MEFYLTLTDLKFTHKIQVLRVKKNFHMRS